MEIWYNDTADLENMLDMRFGRNIRYAQEGFRLMRDLPQVHEIWRHFKNNMYEIITIAEHTETGEKFVIYKALQDTMKTYARPLKDFMSEVDKAKYPKADQDFRFVKVK